MVTNYPGNERMGYNLKRILQRNAKIKTKLNYSCKYVIFVS
jgi:hypothetical protein